MNPMDILRKAILSLAAASLLVASVIAAEDSQITLNYKDADLREVAETIGEITGRTFIIDPRLKGRVTVISKVPMDPGAVYETFLSILQVQGYVAIPSGNVVKIVPEANARQLPADAPTSSQTSGGRDAIIERARTRLAAAASGSWRVAALMDTTGWPSRRPGSVRSGEATTRVV